MNLPTESETLAALEAHYAKSRPKLHRLVAKMFAPYWKYHFAPAWQLALGARYDSQHVSGRRLHSVIFMLPGGSVSVLRSSQERYEQCDFDREPKHACNLNVALAREVNKKEVELAGMVSVPDDGRISAGEIEMGDRKFDVRYSERTP